MDQAAEIAASAVKLAKACQLAEAEMICVNDIKAEPVEWLWQKRIACGKLSVIAGNPGLAKSQLTINIASTVTNGGAWPNGEGLAPIGRVVILSAEDDPADTIKPRLMAAGADLNKCYILNAIKVPKPTGGTDKRTFDLEKDIERLGQEVAKFGDVRLVIIDPISAYLGKTDSNNNSEIRGLLAPLSAMAAKYKVAIIALTHLNKSVQQDMIGRVIGSIGLIAAARAGYAVIKDEKDPDIRYFLPIKNNIGNDKDGFAFKIESVVLLDNIETSKICWQPKLINAHKILQPTDKPTATTAAAEFLNEFLADGPKLAKDIFEAGEGMGYSKSALQRARQRLNIKPKKLGMDGRWEWGLPMDNIDLSRLDNRNDKLTHTGPAEPSNYSEDIEDIMQ